MFAKLAKILSPGDCRRLGIFSLWVVFYEILITFFAFIGQYPFLSKTIFKVLPQAYLIRWDSWHYLDIAQNGYTHWTVCFFPLYPLVVDFFNLFIGNIFVAGFLVSWVALILALFFFWKLLALEKNEEIGRKALFFLLFSPAAIFFSLIYTESLFLFFTVAFFYFLKKEKWLIAALLGFGAALTRSVGVFLFFIFLFHYWEVFRSLPWRSDGFFSKKVKIFLMAFLIPLATFLYAAFCRWKFGDWFFFVSQQAQFTSHDFGWPWQTAAGYFQLIFHSDAFQNNFYYFFRTVFIEAGSFLLCLIAAVYFFVRRENLYGWFCLLNLVMPSLMFPMTSANRYMAVVFPIYIFLARLARRQTVFNFLLAATSVLFAGTIFIISRNWWAG